MPFDITTFKNNLTGGGARPSLFEISLAFPGNLKLTDPSSDGVGGPYNGTLASSALTFMAKASSIPSSTVAPIEVPYFGRKVKFAGNRTFPEWTVTVINDENFIVRRAVEAWLAAINTHKSNVKLINGSDYMCQGSVKQYGKLGSGSNFLGSGGTSPIRQYTFHKVWPSEVSPIELNWGSENEIEEFSITFQYDYWTADEGLGAGGGNNAGGTGGRAGGGAGVDGSGSNKDSATGGNNDSGNEGGGEGGGGLVNI